jgi:Flp pilus assembly protein TadG
MASVRPLRIAPWHGRSGQGLVEFALVIPVFLLLLFGIIDIGRAVFAYTAVANAAREGARVAAVNQLDVPSKTTCNLNMPIEDVNAPRWQAKPCAAKSAVSLGVQPSSVVVGYSAAPGSPGSCSPTLHTGCIVSVTVSAPWSPVTPIISSIIGGLTLSSTSQLPVEAVFP